MTERHLANHERMDKYAAIIEPRLQRLVLAPQMIDPNRGIRQDHLPKRRRGGAFSRGEVPPNRARRRPLSRSIKALSARLIRVDFSQMWFRSWAIASISSARVTVVRMGLLRRHAR